MEKKKTKKADLENKKGLFLQIGLVMALTSILFAFEWKSYNTIELDEITKSSDWIDEEFIYEPIPLPPPPPVKHIPTEIEVVDNTVDVTDQIDIVDIPEDEPNQEYIAPAAPEEIPSDDDIIVDIPQFAPSYEGGEEARLKFLQSNIKYPAMALEAGIQGTVYIGFIVEKDGSISNATIIRPIGGGCDEEALRVVNIMPNWKPGKQGTKAVRVRFTMPVKFVLGK